MRLIDQFSDPSSKVVTASRDMEKRIANTGEVFENAGAIIGNMGGAMTQAITLPLTAAGTAAIKFADESQGAFAQFAAATGTASDAMGKYKDMINNVYKDNFGESINDVADAMAKVDQNMSYLNDSALQSVTKYAMTLSDTLGYDVAESTRAADTLIKNFGIEADEAFNLMAQGAQNGLDFSGEMIDSINEYSVHFAKAGMDANDMFNIIASGAKSGAFNVDKIGDAVKEFSIRAIDGSDTTIAGFQALGMSASDAAAKFAAGGDGAKEVFNQVIQGLASMEDPVAQNTAGVNIFGTMWEDLGADAVMALADTNGAIDMTTASMEEMMNTKYDTLSGALGGLWRTIQVDVLQPIGNMLIPYVVKAIDKIKEMTQWWNNLSPATQKTIVKFAGIAAAVGPVLVGFGKLSTGIGGLIKNNAKLSGAIMRLTGGATGFKGLAAVMTGPVGIAIAAVAAGALLIYKNWDRISPIIQKIGNRFVEFWQTVQPQIQPFFDFVEKIANYLKNTFKPVIDEVFAFAGEFVVGIFEGIGLAIDGLLTALEKVIDFLSGVFSTDWEKVWTGCKDFISNTFSTIADAVKIPINAVINVVNGAIDKINSIHFTVPEWVPGIGGKGWEGLNIPTIPTLATGTDNWKGGIVQINEKGGEIVDLPSGSRVYPHDESVRMARAEGSRKVYISIPKLADQIIVREDADIDRIAEVLLRKLKQTSFNMA